VETAGLRQPDQAPPSSTIGGASRGALETIMQDVFAAPIVGANTSPLQTRAAHDRQSRLIEIDDGVAAIRAQIAAADLSRQASGRKIDPVWFHRAKTALRHLQRERAELVASGATPRADRQALKDAIIAVLRERHDPHVWTAIVDEARARLTGEARR